MIDKKFTWPADMPRQERGWPGTVRINGRRKPAWIVRDIGRRSLDDGFSWILNTAYNPWGGWSEPITRKHGRSDAGPGSGKTSARHGQSRTVLQFRNDVDKFIGIFVRK